MLDEGTSIQFIKSQFQLLPAVHDNGSAPCYRLVKWFCRQEDKPGTLLA